MPNIEINGFTLSPDGTKLLKGCDTEECHIPYGTKVICRHAFDNSQNIKKLYIPETVEELEDYAFSSMKTEYVHIPKSITKWGENAFFGCYYLKEIDMDPDLCTLGNSMFMLCSSLEKIVIPHSIKKIPVYTFSNCEKLTSVILPEQLEQIGDGAFSSCENLEHINLPNSIKRIGPSAFSDCYRLKSLVLPSSLDALSDYLFLNCFTLSEIIVPEGVVAIGESCFYNCSELKTVQLPSSLLYIEENAIDDCYQATIKLPYNSFLEEFYNNHSFGTECTIVRYNASYIGNPEADKKKLDLFLLEMKYKRERDDYEMRKEMGMLTREEIEQENAIYLDAMYNDTDDFLGF